jgi:hypothetical protein
MDAYGQLLARTARVPLRAVPLSRQGFDVCRSGKTWADCGERADSAHSTLVARRRASTSRRRQNHRRPALARRDHGRWLPRRSYRGPHFRRSANPYPDRDPAADVTCGRPRRARSRLRKLFRHAQTVMRTQTIQHPMAPASSRDPSPGSGWSTASSWSHALVRRARSRQVTTRESSPASDGGCDDDCRLHQDRHVAHHYHRHHALTGNGPFGEGRGPAGGLHLLWASGKCG